MLVQSSSVGHSRLVDAPAGTGVSAALSQYVAELWRRRPALTCPIWADGDFEPHRARFAHLRRPHWSDPLLQDVLVCLGVFLRSKQSAFGETVVVQFAAARGINILFTVWDFDEPKLTAFTPLLLSAFKLTGLPFASDEQRLQVRDIATMVVKPSLDAGAHEFVRDQIYDEAILLIVPELAPSLRPGSPGTMEYAKSVCTAGAVSAPQGPAVLPSGDRFAMDCWNAAEALRVFDLRWSRGGDVDFEKWGRFEDACRLPRSDARFVRAAYDARRSGVDFPAFVLDQGVPNVNELADLLKVLRGIYMLS